MASEKNKTSTIDAKQNALSAARQFIDGMTDEQSSAVNHMGEPHLLLAGAGAGKTRTLVARMIKLIMPEEEGGFGAPPDSIMLVTFTNKAAREIRERIDPVLTSLRQADLIPYGDPWAGTFHSLSLRILRSQAVNNKTTSNFSIYDESDSRHLAREAFEQLGAEKYDLDLFFTKLGTAKAHLLTPDFLEQAQETPEEHSSKVLNNYFDTDFVKTYRLYQGFLQDQNAVDFSDLLSRTTELIRNDGTLRDSIRSHFRHFLVDEVQDIDRAQIGWLGALTDWGKPCDLSGLMNTYPYDPDTTPILGNGVNWKRLEKFQRPSVLAVGDDDQAIYSFRGSDSKSLKLLEKRFKNTKISFLTISYRCQPNILDVTNAFVGQNDGRYDKELVPPFMKKPGGPVELREFRSANDEVEALSKIFLSKLEKGESISDHAILVRTRNLARNISRILRGQGIPVVEGRGTDLRSSAEVKDAISFATIFVNPDSELCLRRIINKPSRGIGATSLAKVKANARLKEVNFIDELRSIMNDRIDLPEGADPYPKRFISSLKDFGRMVVSCRKIIETSENAGDALTAILENSGYLADIRKTAFSALGVKEEQAPVAGTSVRELVGWCISQTQTEQKKKDMMRESRSPGLSDQNQLAVDKIGADIQKKISEADQDTLMADSHMISKALGNLSNIAVLIEKASEFSTLNEWLETVTLDMDHTDSRQGVNVMTMHAAKGLEWDTVHLPFWVDGVMPNNKGSDTGELSASGNYEEERRLGYVCMTRAKNSCYISWFNQKPDYTVFPALIMAKQGMGDFIGELKEISSDPEMEGRLNISLLPSRHVPKQLKNDAPVEISDNKKSHGFFQALNRHSREKRESQAEKENGQCPTP